MFDSWNKWKSFSSYEIDNKLRVRILCSLIHRSMATKTLSSLYFDGLVEENN
jgi:hypothetical protein